MNRRSFISGCCAAGAALGLGAAGCAEARSSALWRPAAAERIALVNIELVDVRAGALVSGKALLLRDGLIEGLADETDPRLEQARRIDCGGRYLIPGLINAHTHITEPGVTQFKLSEGSAVLKQTERNYRDCLAFGITTVRDMGALPKVLRRDRAAIDSGELAGPHILSPIAFIAVPGGYPDFLDKLPWMFRAMFGLPVLTVRDAAEARDAVKFLADQGAQLTKIALDHHSLMWGRDALNVFSDEQLEAIRDESDKLGLPLAMHHLYLQGMQRGLRFGADSLEHLVGDQDLSDEQIAALVDRGLPLVPTASTAAPNSFRSQGDPYADDPLVQELLEWNASSVLPELPQHCDPKIVELLERTRAYYENEEYRDPKRQQMGTFNPQHFTRMAVIGNRNLKRLIAAGAVIGAGNDSGIPFMFPGALHFELELLCRSGMTPAQALAAATQVNARICRIEDQAGSLDPGKRADLALLDRNPLETIANVAAVAATFKSGALVHRSPGVLPELG